MKTVRVLLIEDDEDDFILARKLLEEIEGTRFAIDWQSDAGKAMEAIARREHDVYLVDYHLGAHTGLDVLRHAIESGCTAPVIMLTGSGNRSVDEQAMESGAADYLVKAELTAALLDRTIRYAVGHKRAENKLAEMARFDDLTGLANRAMFKELLARATARTRRVADGLAVLFLDLDKFKDVNDTLGHSAGDELLKTVASRLVDCLRETDVVARLGGDEFVVVLEGASRVREAAMVAQRVLDAQSVPVMLEGQEVFVSVSIGIATYEGGEMDVDTLLKNADMAMYEAKQAGRNAYRFHDPRMSDDVVERLTLESDLRRAIERGEMALHYQPQIDVATGAVVGVEALLRWSHPRLGDIPPRRIIATAEDAGLTSAIGEWVAGTACAEALRFQALGLPDLRVAINVSARQFRANDLVAILRRVLDHSGLDPACLDLELTEGPLATDGDAAAQTLRAVKAAGVRVVVDDFGTGYSSLADLKRFPLDGLKVAQPFTHDIGAERKGTAIVKAIVALAHNLDLAVVAEGVETQAQLDFLCAEGCDLAQGYLIAPPMEAESCLAWLRRRLADGAATAAPSPPPRRAAAPA